MDELIKTFVVRGIVFVEEQNVTYAEEFDDHEFSAVHILGEENGEPMAAGRIRFLGEHAKLERIVVRRAFRGKNYGHRLVDYLLSVARNKGFTKFKIHAQAHLKQFYEQHGFEVRGDIFKEAGIDHFLMICTD